MKDWRTEWPWLSTAVIESSSLPCTGPGQHKRPTRHDDEVREWDTVFSNTSKAGSVRFMFTPTCFECQNTAGNFHMDCSTQVNERHSINLYFVFFSIPLCCRSFFGKDLGALHARCFSNKTSSEVLWWCFPLALEWEIQPARSWGGHWSTAWGAGGYPYAIELDFTFNEWGLNSIVFVFLFYGFASTLLTCLAKATSSVENLVLPCFPLLFRFVLWRHCDIIRLEGVLIELESMRVSAGLAEENTLWGDGGDRGWRWSFCVLIFWWFFNVLWKGP